ncbi:MAG: hypothetical protein ACP5G1_01760 [Nanopusillaceae archaeon]
MNNIYNTACVTDKGLEDVVLDEIKLILNRDFEYQIINKKNKIVILCNLTDEERLKLLYLSRTIDNIYKLAKEENENILRIKIDNNEFKYKLYLLENLYDRKYEIKKIKKLKSTVVSKILLYSKIKEGETIINLQDDGSFTLEEGLILKNIPPMFFRKKEILEYSDIFDKLENIKNKASNIKIYCINEDQNILNEVEKNSEKALVSNVVIFRRIDFEWIDLKFKENSIDKIYMFKIKNHEKLSKRDKYIFFHSDKLLKSGGRLYLLLYNKHEMYDKIINNISEYIKKYRLKIIENLIIYHGGKRMCLLVIEKI